MILGMLVLLHFHINFKVSSSIDAKKSCCDFDRYCTKSLDHLEGELAFLYLVNIKHILQDTMDVG